MSLRLIKILFIVIGLLYLLSPYDLLPDMAGLVGRLDDLLVAAYLVYQYYRIKRRGGRSEDVASEENSEAERFDYRSARASHTEWDSARREGEASFGGAKSSASGKSKNTTADGFDPYRIFELPRSATTAEIEARYRELVKRYHPDRVNHLGDEFRTLAHERTVEIHRAYEMLLPKH